MSDQSGAAYLTMLGKIYIVRGSAGEYSDHHTWVVIAFETKAEGERHVEALETKMKGLDLLDYDVRDSNKAKMVDLDPYFAWDEEVDYSVVPLCFGSFGAQGEVVNE